MENHARPIVRRVVSSRLAGRWDDVDDVCSEAGLELLLHLRRVKARSAVRDIADFPAYVATVAANACNQYFRRRRPGRARLKKQIRFLVSEDPEFRFGTSADGCAWCDLAGRPTSVPETRDLDALEERIDADRDLRRILARILEEAGGAVELESVVELVARIWRLPPDPTTPMTGVPLDGVAAEEKEPELSIDRRRFTVRLWQEIRRLPREQRAALLLHLRDHRGNSVLFLFPVSGVASFAQIAATLEMGPDQLSGLWNELPADDHAIATLLGCTRQRVINLRMSARKRLANRMRGER